jgi:hypothetical protein
VCSSGLSVMLSVFLANILLNCLLCVFLVQNIFVFYTVTLILFVDTVACSRISSRESVRIWISIPQTANGKSIVRAPGNLSSVSPPFFLGFTTLWAHKIQYTMTLTCRIVKRPGILFLYPTEGCRSEAYLEIIGLRCKGNDWTFFFICDTDCRQMVITTSVSFRRVWPCATLDMKWEYTSAALC